MPNGNVLLCTQRCLLNYESAVSMNPKAVNRLFSSIFVIPARYCLFYSHEILSYEALDKHEIECGFQPKRCSGCRSEIPKKDLVDHENQCGSIQLSCPDCNFVYQRQDAALRHTENICLKLQLRQMREETQVNKQELRKLVRQLADMQLRSKIRGSIRLLRNSEPALSDAVPAKRTINFSDLPDATGEPKWMPNIYQGMQWTEIYYMSRAYVNAKYPISGYSSAFNSVGSSNISFFKDEGSLSSQYKNVVFTLVSITVCSAWKDGLELTITGYRQSLDTNTHNAVLLFCKPQVIFLQWENIDEVVFKCSGGTIHAETQELPNDNQVIITQLTLS